MTMLLLQLAIMLNWWSIQINADPVLYNAKHTFGFCLQVFQQAGPLLRIDSLMLLVHTSEFHKWTIWEVTIGRISVLLFTSW